MALMTDEMRRVIYSRYLLERAKTLQARHTDLSSAEAILAAHDAAEMLMRVVYDNLKITPPSDFMGFWKLVKAATQKEPPFRHKMDSLNEQRNEFKHGGNLPHQNTVEGLLVSVSEFCEDISRDYLHIDFNAATLTALIQTGAAKADLDKASQQHAAGDLKEAIASLRTAFLELYTAALKRFAEDLQGPISWSVPSISTGHLDIDQAVRKIIQSVDIPLIVQRLNNTTEAVNMFVLGVDPVMYRKFIRLTPSVLRFGTGQTVIDWQPRQIPTAEDYEFCRSFVTNFALQNSV